MDKSITVTAKTYDEAITKALIELQTTSEHLHVDVIEKGSSGLFGVLGGKNCVITARVMSEEEENAEKEKQEKEAARLIAEKEAQEKRIKEEEEKRKQEAEENIKTEAQKNKDSEISKSTVGINNSSQETDKEFKTRRHDEEKRDISEEEVAEIYSKTEDFLKQIFVTMKMQVSVETSFDHNENELGVIMNGEDMGILIGKRGQTLDSLQYLVSLVVNKHREGYIRVRLDTENYRERRKEKLESLAKSIAIKVKRTKRSVSLEPMNPYERRIIHSTLQSDPYIITHSEGEDPYRHIVVDLKK